MDPAFLIRGGPNSEIFLSDLRKLFKRDKFLGMPEKWDPRPEIPRWDPGPRTPISSSEIQDPRPLKWDPGPQNFQVDLRPGTPEAGR